MRLFLRRRRLDGGRWRIIGDAINELNDCMNRITDGFIVRVGSLDTVMNSLLLEGVFEIWVRGRPVHAVPYRLVYDAVVVDRLAGMLSLSRNRVFTMYRALAKGLVRAGIVSEYMYAGDVLVLGSGDRYYCVATPHGMAVYDAVAEKLYGRLDVRTLAGSGLFRVVRVHGETYLVPRDGRGSRVVRGLAGSGEVYFGRAFTVRNGRPVNGYLLYYDLPRIGVGAVYVDVDDRERARRIILDDVVSEMKKMERRVSPRSWPGVLMEYSLVLRALGVRPRRDKG